MVPRVRPLLIATCLALQVAACTNRSLIGRQPADAGWVLTWADEFDGPAGSAPSAASWTAETGSIAVNGELQYYTTRPVNVELDGNGHLAIHVLRESTYPGYEHTSGRISSQGHFAQEYGRFEARIKMPYGQGLWPAFWMLGEDFTSAGWPQCGGIDVAEAYGHESSTVRAGIHTTASAGMALVAAVDMKTNLSEAFHAFAIEWEPSEIRWYADDRLWQIRQAADLPAGSPWPFDHPFFMILNVAVGGWYAGAPDASTPLPQTMLVDHVRVYSR